MDKDTLNLVVAFFYIIATLGILGMFFYAFKDAKFRRKGRHELRANLREMIQNNRPIVIDNLRIYADSLHLREMDVIIVLRDLFTELEFQKERLDTTVLFRLLKEYEKQEPYSEFPKQMSYALTRLKTLSEESIEKADHYLMDHLKPLLDEYLLMKSNQKSDKVKTNLSFGFGLIGTFLSLMIFIFS